MRALVEVVEARALVEEMADLEEMGKMGVIPQAKHLIGVVPVKNLLALKMVWKMRRTPLSIQVC